MLRGTRAALSCAGREERQAGTCAPQTASVTIVPA